MQHQNQGSTKELNAGTTGSVDLPRAVSPEEIERHIAKGKRMQAEAIAGLFKACFSRLRNFTQQRSHNDGHLSRA